MEIKKNKGFDFSSVEKGIGFALHPDIKKFYSAYLNINRITMYKGLKLELVQVEKGDEFLRLQENILGHLVMLQRLKQPPTVFIASVKDENKVISIDNETGEVLYEYLGTAKRVVLEPTLDRFLQKIEINM